MMMRWLAGLMLMIVATLTPARAATQASPGNVVSVTVSTDNDGRMIYAVSRNGKPVLANSELGFLFTDGPQMLRNFELVDEKRSSHDDSWTQPWGEWTTIRNRYNEMQVRFREKSTLKREIIVTFRVFDDGIGFRYEFPDQGNLKTINIAEELTEFKFASSGTGWWKPAFLFNREEYLYEKTPLAAIGTADTPVTIQLTDGPWVALHEAALVDYSGMAVMKTTGNTLRALLTPGAGQPKVVGTAPFKTPWRTLIIADDAPYIFLYYQRAWSGQNKRIQGIEPTALGIGWNSEDWYIQEMK